MPLSPRARKPAGDRRRDRAPRRRVDPRTT